MTTPQQQGITVSRSFRVLQGELAPLEQALTQFTARAAEKLRERGLMCEKVSVFASSNRFDTKAAYYSRSASCDLPRPSDYTPEILHYAAHLLRQIYKPGIRFIKAGVMLLDLAPATREKRDLLDDRDQVRQASLIAALDALNQRYGKRKLHFGDAGTGRGQRAASWIARADMTSAGYTTARDQLAKVR